MQISFMIINFFPHKKYIYQPEYYVSVQFFLPLA